jgi:hypothetical protein
MRKRLPVLLVLIMILSLGCASSHQQRVNTISDAMHAFNIAYEETEVLLINLRDQGGPVADRWSEISRIRNQVAPIVIRLNENWRLVPQTDASVEAFILQPDFQSAVALALQLVAIAGDNGLELRFNQLVR